MDVIEIDAATGEITERAFTAEEKAQRETDRIAFEKQQAKRETEAAAKIAARESAVAKLSALGLNEVEINAMMGGV